MSVVAQKSSITSGLYIVTLNNDEGIGVNANDPRYADTCLRVDRHNCKFGKARDFNSRQKNYERTFGSENVNFFPIVALANCEMAEKIVLAALRPWRVRHTNGRLHEWLVGLSASDLEQTILVALNNAGVLFERIGSAR